MTLTERFNSFFYRHPTPNAAPPALVTDSFVPAYIPVDTDEQPDLLTAGNLYSPLDSLPAWLSDEESLRDEGVLFGLSDARPDEKIAQIRFCFDQLTAPLNQTREQQAEKIAELNEQLGHQEARVNTLINHIDALQNRQPARDNLIRTIVSLFLSLAMCTGTFFLIDETLRPTYPNRWIAVGVFLAGMFNLFGRMSFFYEEGSRLTGWRLLEEVGLPLAASVFVLAQALQTQPVWQAIALFAFVFFLFLLAGKLLLGTLTVLRQDLAVIEANRQLRIDKQQQIPAWEVQLTQARQEANTLRAHKWPLVTALNRVEADLTRLNARRDQLVNLFLSEFELARSLRDRLTEQQRREVLRSYNVV